MNKKSRIKTTLDNLFTGGKLPAEEKPPVPAAEPPVEKKPTAPRKKEAAVKPAAATEKPVVKPPEKPKPEIKVEPVTTVSTTEEVIGIKPEILITETQPAQMPEASPAMEKAPEPAHIEKPAPAPVQEKKTMDEEKVLELARTIDLASDSQSMEEEHLVIFSLGKELYGVTIHAVESIIKLQAITQVPRTVPFILGVTNLRGTVVPVLDLRIRFNLAHSEDTANTRIVIVNSEGSKVGIVVDEVTEVLKVSRNTIQPPPPLSTTIESAFISGIARIDDRLVILLDLEKVLASSSRQHNR